MKTLLVILLTLTATNSWANTYHWKIKRAIDGDTLAVETNFLPDELKLSVRVRGVDTPEKSWRAKCDKERELGERATKFTARLIKKAKLVTFSNIEWGKWGGRVVADVDIDGVGLNERLINSGLGRYYSGRSRRLSWCN